MPHPTRFALLHIGDELLSGQRENALTAPLASRIRAHGGAVLKAVVLPDERDRVAGEIRSALREGLAVVSTGGLGPTDDDITRDAFADALGTDTLHDADAVARLTERRTARGQPTRAADLRQALVLRGGLALGNPAGDAIGIGYASGNHGEYPDIFLLPGPPREVLPMWDEGVTPHLGPRVDGESVTILRTIGWRTASEVDAMLRPHCPDGVALSFGTDSGILDIRISSPADSRLAAAAFSARVRELAGEHVFGTGNRSLLEATLTACRDSGLPLSCALDIPLTTDCAPRELNLAIDAVRRRALAARRA